MALGRQLATRPTEQNERLEIDAHTCIQLMFDKRLKADYSQQMMLE